ncbi:hypothetical protein AcV7_005994 [Taiwanofungus camphoratus]|nr:hypothetical protein AcV7_005994 [Antrodia cinnamomea]
MVKAPYLGVYKGDCGHSEPPTCFHSIPHRRHILRLGHSEMPADSHTEPLSSDVKYCILSDGTRVPIPSSATRGPLPTPDEFLTLYLNLRDQKNFSIDIDSVVTVEDAFKLLMDEIRAIRLLACGLLHQHSVYVKHVIDVSARLPAEIKDIQESYEVMQKMVTWAVEDASSFDKRLRVLQKMTVSQARSSPLTGGSAKAASSISIPKTPYYPSVPSFLPPAYVAQPDNQIAMMRTLGTNYGRDHAVDSAILETHNRTLAKPSSTTPTSTSTLHSVDTSASSGLSNGLPLSPQLKIHIKRMEREVDDTRQLIPKLLDAAVIEEDIALYYKEQQGRMLTKHWGHDHKSLLSKVSKIGYTTRPLRPVLEKFESLWKETGQTESETSRFTASASSTPPAPPVVRDYASTSPLPASLPHDSGSIDGTTASETASASTQLQELDPRSDIYSMTLSISCDKPVDELTNAEVKEVLKAFPLTVTFDLGEMDRAQESDGLEEEESSKSPAEPEQTDVHAQSGANAQPNAADLPRASASDGPAGGSLPSGSKVSKKHHKRDKAVASTVDTSAPSAQHKKHKKRRSKKVAGDDPEPVTLSTAARDSHSRKRSRDSVQEEVDVTAFEENRHTSGPSKKKRTA